jgi:hypothetical protein
MKQNKVPSLISKGLLLILFYPWMIGCSYQHELRTKDENSLEFMGGSGVSTVTMYEIETVPTCGSGSETIRRAFGKYDAGFVDAGFRWSHYSGSNNVAVELGAGVSTTVSRSKPNISYISENPVESIQDHEQTPYGFINYGKDYDYYGWRIGLFFADKFHYQDPLIFPTIRLRYGRADAFRLELGTMREPTCLSSGSIVDAGLGFGITAIKTDLYLGLGYSQYDDTQILLQSEIHTSKNFSLKADMNFGAVAGSKEFGIGCGIKIRW